MRKAIVAALLIGATRAAWGQVACPDSTMLSRTIGQQIATAYANRQSNSRVAPPEPCWYSAVARAPYAHSDSVVIQTLALSDDALRELPENPEILRARVILLSRMRRYADVGPAMDALFVARPVAADEETHRLTVGAAMQLHDTAAIINRLANAAGRFPRSKTLAPEYEIWRQNRRLRALIDTVHRMLAKDPSLTVGFVNLTSIYGNLDQPDSAIAYAKRALRAGVDRAAVGTALESLIGVRMRRAKIIDTPDLWRATVPVAKSVDATLSTAASRYLVALSLAEVVKGEARLAQYIGYGIESGEPNGFGLQATTASGTSYLKVMTCTRLTELEGMIDEARAKLAAGGDKFASETIPALRSGLAAMATTLAQLKPRCA